jgi:tetratricopeptide (TPR) repeat protein
MHLSEGEPPTGLHADVTATALAVLHVGWGEVPEVRAFLDARSTRMASGSTLRLRWARALQQIGATWDEAESPERAVRAYTRSQEVLPDDPEILLDLAVSTSRSGRVEESLPYFIRSLQLDPTQSYGFVNLGLALESLGREADAESVYRRAITSFPFEALGHVNLGNIHLRRGEFPEAASAYAQGVAIDPSLALANYYLAVALVNQNDLAGARLALHRSLEFAPGDADAMDLLRRIEELIRQEP